MIDKFAIWRTNNSYEYDDKTCRYFALHDDRKRHIFVSLDR